MDDDWPIRIRKIQILTQDSAYPVRFALQGKNLIRITRRLPRCSKKIISPTPFQAQSIALQLRAWHNLGIAHGDVHAKNIWWDGEQAVLMDHEPSLIQLIGDRPCLMCTSPKIHPQDRKTQKLTPLTDHLCFAMWAHGLSLQESIKATSTNFGLDELAIF